MALEILGTINWGGYLSSIVTWVGYILLSLLILGSMAVFAYVLQYNIKAETWALYGSSKDGVYTTGRKKKNRFKWIKHRTAWKPLFPLFNKVELEPFDSEFIYPGKQVYCFILNDVWVPGRMNVIPVKVNVSGSEETKLTAQINPAPYYVRNWQSLTHKRNAREFAEHNFWEDNKHVFVGVITVALCLVMCGLTIYFSYKYSTGGTSAASSLADALRNFNVAQGINPPG